MIDLSVIVVSYNTSELTEQSIRTVMASLDRTPDISYEIIVVDNNSQDESHEMLRSLRKKHSDVVKLIFNSDNVGFGRANNIGAAQAKGQLLLLLNSDMIADKLDFSLIKEEFEKDDKLGAFTVRVNLANGKIDPACHRGFPTVWRSLTYFAKLEKLTQHIPVLNRLFGGYHLTHLQHGTRHEIDAPTAAFMVIRTSVFRACHGFDERFFMYAEDIDLALRIKKMGYTIIYDPSQTVIHLKNQSGIKHVAHDHIRRSTKKHFYQTMYLFFEKHYAADYPVFIRRIIETAINYKVKSFS